MQTDVSRETLATMGRRRYSETEREQALRIYETEGPAAAALATGIPKGTIASWAGRTGLHTVCNETNAQAVQAASLKWEQRRLQMVHRMGEVAEEALELADSAIKLGSPNKAKDAATTMAILVDKAQLLTGAATSRHETVSGSQVDEEIRRLTEQMADVGAS